LNKGKQTLKINRLIMKQNKKSNKMSEQNNHLYELYGKPKKSDLQSNYKEIEPHMLKANEELKKITDNEIGEVVKMAVNENLPADMKDVIVCIKIITDIKDPKLLQDAIKKIRTNGIKEPPSTQALRKLEKITKKRDFNVAY